MSSTLSNVLEPGAEPIPGYRLRQYRGRGGFAVVWEADDPDGRRVALKFISTERMGADLTTAREIRSVQAIRQLYHRGLLPIYGIWSINRAIVIAMELADGSLMDLLDAYQQEFRTAIPPEFLAAYTEQAAEALDYLNARRHVLDGKRVGIQHGDVKPNNILLVGERVKLADFGLVAMLSSFFSTNYPSGTVAYAAPEVFQGALSEWTDQYSLAVTYCVLRTGSLPFRRLPSRFSGQYVRPEADLSRLPPAEATVIERALSLHPPDRWPDCRTLAAELGKILRKNRSSPALRLDTPISLRMKRVHVTSGGL